MFLRLLLTQNIWYRKWHRNTEFPVSADFLVFDYLPTNLFCVTLVEVSSRWYREAKQQWLLFIVLCKYSVWEICMRWQTQQKQCLASDWHHWHVVRRQTLSTIKSVGDLEFTPHVSKCFTDTIIKAETMHFYRNCYAVPIILLPWLITVIFMNSGILHYRRLTGLRNSCGIVGWK